MTKINLCGIELKNPVIAASGTFGFGREYDRYIDLNRLGGVSTKGLTIREKQGNEGIRIHETPAGIMNSIGLQNPSIQSFIDDELDFMNQFDFEILANVGGNNINEYVKGVELISQTNINIIELNISCPNVKEGGMAFGIKCESAYEVVKAVREVTDKVLMVKLSPNAESVSRVAYECQRAGADCVSLVNTFNALAVDIYKRKPVFKNVTAGLSGPCIKPIALRMVREVFHAVDIPVIGMGGIMNWQDAIEFIMAGATAIQVGTANFVHPNCMIEIIEGIENFMEQQQITNLKEITGII